MITTRKVAYAAVLALVLAVVAGCAGTPKPTPARITLVAAADVNPDIEGHPAPIVVRIYQLKEEGGFNSLHCLTPGRSRPNDYRCGTGCGSW